MAVYGNMVITQQGADLYGKVQTGDTLTFTRMQIGSGQFQSSAQLSSALTSGTAYTSLSVAALTGAIPSGSTITIGTGATTQTVTTSAYAAIGDTSISVNSFTANAAYASGAPLTITPYQSGLTALITPVDYFNINSATNSDGTVNIRSIFENTDLTSSTYTCEIGLFAQDPDLGEILYGYANAGAQGDTIPPYADGPYSRQFTISIAIGSATSVTANVPENTYVLASTVGTDGGVASLDPTGNVPEDQLGNVPLPANATTTNPGLLQASAVPTSGPPVAITKSDLNWGKLTGGTTSVADSEHTHQNFPKAVTFAAGAILPSGETLTVAGTGTVTGTLEASGSGIIHATNSDSLGGQGPSYYLAATAQAVDSAKLNGEPPSYYAVAANTALVPIGGTWTVPNVEGVTEGTIYNIVSIPAGYARVFGVGNGYEAYPPETSGYTFNQWQDSSNIYLAVGNTTYIIPLTTTTMTNVSPCQVGSYLAYGWMVPGYFRIYDGYLQFVAVANAAQNGNDSYYSDISSAMYYYVS